MIKKILLLVLLSVANVAAAKVSVKEVDATLRAYASGDVDEAAINQFVELTDSLDRETVIRRFERIGKQSVDVAQLEAALLHSWGMYDRALTVYERLVKNDQADSDLFRWYADCVRRVKGQDAAYSILHTAVEKSPDDGYLKLELARVAVACSRYEEAISLLDVLIDANPGNDDLLREKINALNALKASLEK